jgi:D-alanine-D-alanine ligase
LHVRKTDYQANGRDDLKIAVLCGGVSSEREVSLVTGRAVGLALCDAGFDVLLVDTALGDRPVGPREAHAAASLSAAPAQVSERPGAALEAVSGDAVSHADVVFLALHGGAGENGTIQGLLELAGKRYTGSGVLASALAMDKRMSKIAFREAGVPTPDWRVVDGGSGNPVDGGGSPDDVGRSDCRGRSDSPVFPGDLRPEYAAAAARELGGYPVVVKPNDQGSTVGLSIVRAESDLAGAVALAGRYSRNVLIESYVPGRELTVTVLGERALPVVEIAPKSGFYDYESKYTKGMTEYTCPADIPEALAGELRDSALRAFRALGLRGYARADYRLAPSRQYHCLEVNTLPGMTELSLVPMAARAAGIEFPELCREIVEMALK